MDETTQLPREDELHLMAAEGWLELGSHLDANEELEKVSPALGSSSDAGH